MSNPCKLPFNEVNNGLGGVCSACGYMWSEHRKEVVTPNPSNSKQTVDDILYRFHGRVFLDGDTPTMSFIDDAKQQLTQLINEIIGKTRVVITDNDSAVNEVIYQQRTRAIERGFYVNTK